MSDTPIETCETSLISMPVASIQAPLAAPAAAFHTDAPANPVVSECETRDLAAGGAWGGGPPPPPRRGRPGQGRRARRPPRHHDRLRPPGRRAAREAGVGAVRSRA